MPMPVMATRFWSDIHWSGLQILAAVGVASAVLALTVDLIDSWSSAKPVTAPCCQVWRQRAFRADVASVTYAYVRQFSGFSNITCTVVEPSPS